MSKYVVSYELCALCFIIVAAFHYFPKKRFPSRANDIFSAFFVIGIADIVFDVVSAHLIENPGLLPIWVATTVTAIYYILQVTIACMLPVYVDSLCGGQTRNRRLKIVLLCIPCAVTVVLSILSCFIGVMFHFDAGGGSTAAHGTWRCTTPRGFTYS